MLSFVGSVIAEIISGNKVIGNVMLIASSNFNVPLVFAALLVVGIMGVSMYPLFALLGSRSPPARYVVGDSNPQPEASRAGAGAASKQRGEPDAHRNRRRLGHRL